MAKWFKRFAKNNFEHLFLPMSGKAFRYLEIGVYEGDSLSWMAENALQNATAAGVDPYLPMKKESKERMDSLWETVWEKFSSHNNILLTRMTSRDYLRADCSEYDVIYIDGAHDAWSVLEDSVLAWPRLKPGGLLLWDDYGFQRENRLTVRHAVDAFLSCHHPKTFERVELPSDWQYCVRKR